MPNPQTIARAKRDCRRLRALRQTIQSYHAARRIAQAYRHVEGVPAGIRAAQGVAEGVLAQYAARAKPALQSVTPVRTGWLRANVRAGFGNVPLEGRWYQSSEVLPGIQFHIGSGASYTRYVHGGAYFAMAAAMGRQFADEMRPVAIRAYIARLETLICGIADMPAPSRTVAVRTESGASIAPQTIPRRGDAEPIRLPGGTGVPAATVRVSVTPRGRVSAIRGGLFRRRINAVSIRAGILGGAVAALAVGILDGEEEWQAGEVYRAGDTVMRSGVRYRARRLHTARAGNAPPNRRYWERA